MCGISRSCVYGECERSTNYNRIWPLKKHNPSGQSTWITRTNESGLQSQEHPFWLAEDETTTGLRSKSRIAGIQYERSADACIRHWSSRLIIATKVNGRTQGSMPWIGIQGSRGLPKLEVLLRTSQAAPFYLRMQSCLLGRINHNRDERRSDWRDIISTGSRGYLRFGATQQQQPCAFTTSQSDKGEQARYGRKWGPHQDAANTSTPGVNLLNHLPSSALSNFLA